MSEHRCEYCDGTVRDRILPRHGFNHAVGFVILENVPVGVCDQCGNHYYDAIVLKRVHELATGKRSPARTEVIPVGSI